MNTIQDNNGHEGAENSSKQNNDSNRRSLYCDALEKYFGCEGLTGPVPKVRNGIDYTFDFYDAAEDTLIKILTPDTLEEHAKYVAYPGDKLVLLDAKNLDCGTMPIGNDGDQLLAVRSDINQYAGEGGSACLYFEERLWLFQDRTQSGMTLWHPVSLD